MTRALLGGVTVAIVLSSAADAAAQGDCINLNDATIDRRCVPSGGGRPPAPAPATAAPAPREDRSRDADRAGRREFYSDEADVYIQRQDWDNAIRSLETALEYSPDDEELLRKLARARAARANSRPRPVNSDPRVVEVPSAVRGGADWLAQVPGLAQSPEVERIRRGYQSVMMHDWNAAHGWWQDALNRDPKNAALQRSVELARRMLDQQRTLASRPQTPLTRAARATHQGDGPAAFRALREARGTGPATAAVASAYAEADRLEREGTNIAPLQPGELGPLAFGIGSEPAKRTARYLRVLAVVNGLLGDAETERRLSREAQGMDPQPRQAPASPR